MNVLNFGSLNIDHVYQVTNVVRPGETISSHNLEYFCGGKGLNQSIALAKAGAHVYHAGKIGTDGGILKDTLMKSGVNTDYLSQSEEVNGHAIIQVDKSGQNCIVLYGGSNLTMTEEYVDSVLSSFHSDDIVLMQNETNCTGYIAEQCHKKGIKVVLNPSPINKELLSVFPFQLVSMFLINQIEGTELTQKTNPTEILDSLLEKYPESSFVLTLGKRGVVYKDKVHTFSHGTYKVPVVDTTAAGDTFTGFFLGCLANGLDIPNSLKKASVASSLAVSKQGASVSIPLMEEVIQAESQLIYQEF